MICGAYAVQQLKLMKTNSLLSILLMSAMLCFNIAARADGHEGSDDQGDNDDQGENCQGGHIDGTETLVATVTLVPTTNGPVDASGVANLISENEDGVVTSSFSLSITGLTAGVYDLSIVKKSDGSTVDLGQFTIGRSCHGDDDEEDNDDEGEGEGEDDEHDGDHKCCQWAAFLDEADVQLPADLDPMDIAQILISDADGNVVLVGDLVNPTATTKIKFSAKIRVHSSTSATASTVLNNKAQALSTAKRGKRTDRFTMIASGLTPNTTYAVTVNGQNAGTVKSSSKGKVLVRKVPANLLVVKSVHLVDANGNTAVRAKF